ncbi:MAG TPA: 16S rRNA processing protein RimM [Firmicutes bacterium]|nr:16S rRNA processing protein RimM [Bacillota bacterium]
MRPERAVIGRVLRPHGVRGEILVLPTTDVANRFRGLTTVWFVRDGEELGKYEVESTRAMTKGVGLKLRRIDDRDIAAKFRGADVTAPALSPSELADREYFVSDLVGLVAKNDDGEVLGTVAEVIDNPAHAVLVIDSDGKQWQVPLVSEFVSNVDIEGGVVALRLIEGLRDL